MKAISSKIFSVFTAFAMAIGMVGQITRPVSAAGTISLAALGTSYTQDFNTLEYRLLTSSNAVPTGWDFTETGMLANSDYLTSSGILTIGDTYSFGAINNTERSFGGLRGTFPSLNPTIGASFTNNTGGTITSLAVSYTGEEWRLGTAGRTDRLDFQLSTNATSLSNGTWTDYNNLDFITPVTTSTGPKNGNVSPNRTAISYTITGLSIIDSATFWIRWQDYDVTTGWGIDDGLAVDDFSLTPAGLMPDTAPSVLSISPADAASDVPMDSDIVITLSEAVNVTDPWDSLSCSTSGAHTVVITGGPIVYTLNPDFDFDPNESCTVTVTNTAVTDVDSNDPPDAMAANFISTFSVSDVAPFVLNTSPADGDINVLISSSITVNFSENVTVSESSFTLNCASSGIHAVSISGNNTSVITLSPAVDSAHNEVCTLTVKKDDVSDVDTYDPPDNMTSDYIMSFTTTEPAPYVLSFSPANDVTLIGVKVYELTAVFNKDVVHDSGEYAADNLVNYLLVEQGLNNLFDTLTCDTGLQLDDTSITINSVIYNPVTFTSSLSINDGEYLPEGDYRLFVCGTTSIHDQVGNTLNDGQYDAIADFHIRFPTAAAAFIPATGFAPERVTNLPAQTVTYTTLGDLWLEIPSLKVNTPIVGVPQTGSSWDVTWLGSQVGWLAGSAYPTALGNSVLTAHVWDALNKPGAFYALDKLSYGDRVIVHSYGKAYTYEIRQVLTVAPSNLDAMLKHQDDTWLTLVTCKGFNTTTDQYAYRTLVRAVLVDVK